ncbi:hypothetical protein Ahy_A06g028670 [Arachis hypogaea]|uniref:Uncharacterized protein n=1 Tax=Arachis hypogaea TaxID=3818 RepID=A0A445CRK8_ARAHY|nr:hypothetical protein Ahy_A06g028670 [Arachis hypogaea]
MTKEPINQSIHCNREDFRGSRVKAPTQKNTVAAMGCRVRVYAKFDRERQDWVLLKIDLSHSHTCSTKKTVYYHENKELTMHAKCMIEVNDVAGIQLNKTFLALANEVGGPSNLGFSEKDVRNYISSRFRSTNVNTDVKEMLNYFMRMKEINLNFFYAVNVDDDYKFRSAVWVDARCRASYDVVLFDTTYSTNRFASFKLNNVLSLLRYCIVLVFCFENLFLMWASMRSTQRSESMHTFFGRYLHCARLFVHVFDNVLGNKEQKKLEDDATDSRGLISCATSSVIEG